MDQAKVIALEGLGIVDNPRPLQKAFTEGQAAQCGCCINGMITAGWALLNKNRHPTCEAMCHCLQPTWLHRHGNSGNEHGVWFSHATADKSPLCFGSRCQGPSYGSRTVGYAGP